jgi:hypothetical protein
MKGLTTNPPALFIVNNNTPYPEGSFDHWIGHIERHIKFPEFKKFWKLYKLVGTVPATLPGNPDSTSFSVYERKK